MLFRYRPILNFLKSFLDFYELVYEYINDGRFNGCPSRDFDNSFLDFMNFTDFESMLDDKNILVIKQYKNIDMKNKENKAAFDIECAYNISVLFILLF